jgi:hypothetical protein
MSTRVSIFPETIGLTRLIGTAAGFVYDSPWTLDLGNGALIHLSDEQADALACLLWNRAPKEEAAA